MHALSLKIVGLALLAAACMLILFISRAHWWKRMSAAQVVYGGQSFPSADVYRSPKGELLLNLQGPSEEGELFVIYPAENKVGMPNRSHFFFLPGYVFSRYVPPLVVFMDDPVKAGQDPTLQVGPDSVGFLLRGRRVQIVVREPWFKVELTELSLFER